MTKCFNKGAGLGGLLLAGGVGAMLADFSLASFGRVAVIVGAILWCYHRLQEKNTTATETYRIGYDMGYEKGYQDRGEEEHPTVVDISSLRGVPGKQREFSSAGSVVDRG